MADRPETAKNAAKNTSLLQGATYLIAYQFGTRLLTFALNIALTRKVGPALYGTAEVKFQLVITTILFLTRECFRRGLLRFQVNNQKDAEDIWTLSMVSVPLGGFLSLIVCTLFLTVFRNNEIEGYSTSIALYGISAIIEMISEPSFILSEIANLCRTRFVVEFTAVIIKVLFTYFFAVYFNLGALSFALAHFSFSILDAIGHIYGFYRWYCIDPKGPRFSSTFVIPKIRFSAFHPARCILVGTFFIQCLLEYVLTEGEKWVMIMTVSLYDQGLYALVVNLGSLFLRTIVQPLEERSFVMFTRLSAELSNLPKRSDIDGSGDDNSNSGDDGIDSKDEDDVDTLGDPKKTSLSSLPPSQSIVTFESKVQEIADIFSMMFKIMLMLGLVFVSLGSPYAHSVVFIFYGTQWSETSVPKLFSWYCLFIFFAVLNGLTEAFARGTANARELRIRSKRLFVVSIVYLATTAIMADLFGVVGFVLANCINMSMRICLSFVHATAFFKDTRSLSISSLIPSTHVCLAFVTAGVATRLSQILLLSPRSELNDSLTYQFFVSFPLLGRLGSLLLLVDKSQWMRMIVHFCVGGVAILMILITILLAEREFLDNILSQVVGKRIFGTTRKRTDSQIINEGKKNK